MPLKVIRSFHCHQFSIFDPSNAITVNFIPSLRLAPLARTAPVSRPSKKQHTYVQFTFGSCILRGFNSPWNLTELFFVAQRRHVRRRPCTHHALLASLVQRACGWSAWSQDAGVAALDGIVAGPPPPQRSRRWGTRTETRTVEISFELH